MVALIGLFHALISGAFSGLILDRFGYRTCFQAAQFCILLNAASVALLLWLDQLEYWHLAVTASITSTIWTVDWPTRCALIPDLVGKELNSNLSTQILDHNNLLYLNPL